MLTFLTPFSPAWAEVRAQGLLGSLQPWAWVRLTQQGLLSSEIDRCVLEPLWTSHPLTCLFKLFGKVSSLLLSVCLGNYEVKQLLIIVQENLLKEKLLAGRASIMTLFWLVGLGGLFAFTNF